MKVKALEALYVIGVTYFFIASTSPSESLPIKSKIFKAPLKLSQYSKFSRLFYEQFSSGWKKEFSDGMSISVRGAVLAKDMPLYFLSNDTGCALVLLEIEGLIVIGGDGNKFAIGETGMNSNGSFVYIYGFNTISRKFDLLLKKRISRFLGTISRPNSDCPDLYVTLHPSVVTRFIYSASKMRYVPSLREGEF